MTGNGRISEVRSAAAPRAVGPYAQAVQWEGMVFASGQIGIDPGQGTLVSDRVGDQTSQALANLGNVLAAAGSRPDRVLKTTVYLTDIADFKEMNEAYAAYFSPHKPARAIAAGGSLPLGAKVEIEAIAVVDKEAER